MFVWPRPRAPSRLLITLIRRRSHPGHSLAVAIIAVAFLLFACAPASAPPPAGSGPAASPPSGAAAPTAPPARLPVRIGYGSITGNNLGLWVAHDAGLFAEQGLDVVDFPLIEGGTLVIQSLIAGDVQFVLAGSSGIIAAVLRGAELQMIAGASNKFDFALIAVPGIRTGDDLRGKRVGVSRFGSSSDFAARTALDHLGLDANRDVTMLQVGGTSARLGALQSGAIDAAPQIAPALLTAQKLGFNMLVDLATLGVPYEGGPISTTRAIATENPDLARRMIRGYLAGIHRMKTDKPLALEVSRRYLQTDDQAILEESWEHFALKVIPEVPYLVEAALLSVLRELATEDPQAAAARPDQFYDNRFLREAEESGFVRQLYGR